MDASITHGGMSPWTPGFGRGFTMCVLFVVLYIVLCLDHFMHELSGAHVFVVCVGGLCGKLVRAHGGCLGIESR